MAADERASRRRKGEDPPVARTGTPPPQVPDWNWLLQTLMGLQKTVGELSQAVAMLTGRVDRLEDKVDQVNQRVEQVDRKVDRLDQKVDRLDRKVERIYHAIYAAGVVLTAIGAVALWVLNAASDEIMAVVKEALLRSVD